MSTPHITDGESAVLEPLWRLGPLPPVALVEEVSARRGWGKPTVKTLLARLMRKGVVRSEREQGLLRYRALVGRDDYIAAEVQALVERLFQGDPGALLAYLEARHGGGSADPAARA